MVAMGFLSCRSESVGLCGRTEAANAITVAFTEKCKPFDAGACSLNRSRLTDGAYGVQIERGVKYWEIIARNLKKRG
jgi:hypothetical protein